MRRTPPHSQPFARRSNRTATRAAGCHVRNGLLMREHRVCGRYDAVAGLQVASLSTAGDRTRLGAPPPPKTDLRNDRGPHAGILRASCRACMDAVRSRCSARSSGVGSAPTIFGHTLAQRHERKRPLASRWSNTYRRVAAVPPFTGPRWHERSSCHPGTSSRERRRPIWRARISAPARCGRCNARPGW